MKKIAIIGAGFSGAVIAEQLAKTGKFDITVFDERSHIAGNCHTERDKKTGIMVHVYGPHIFHTSNEDVWRYINQFDEFMPFTNRVKAHSRKRVFPLPVNLLTINTLFNIQLNPNEAKDYIKSISRQDIVEPVTFEEQALKFVGNEIYETFFKYYTMKQWGVHPSQLPSSILKRLPIRFNYDDNYYDSIFQGMPKNGYTYIIEKMFSSPQVKIILNKRMSRDDVQAFDHVFYTGPIDAWFGFSEGRLGYRTLKFATEYHEGDYQGNPVINYCDADVPFTRITEHKHFSPWEKHDNSVIYKEYSLLCGEGDVPYYPLRLQDDMEILARYQSLTKQEDKTIFLGRLGTYRYLDMHVCIAEALEIAKSFLKAHNA